MKKHHTTEVLCRCCNQLGYHQGRGLRVGCYERHADNGTIHQYPPLRTWIRTIGRIQDYTELRHIERLSLPDAAARLGVHKRTAERYEAKLKNGQAVATC